MFNNLRMVSSFSKLTTSCGSGSKKKNIYIYIIKKTHSPMSTMNINVLNVEQSVEIFRHVLVLCTRRVDIHVTWVLVEPGQVPALFEPGQVLINSYIRKVRTI